MNDPGLLPPSRHGAQARRLSSRDAAEELWLPVCQACGRVDYPLRELCTHCLSDRLEWQAVGPGGTALAITTLHRSNLPYFEARLPLRIASVGLDAGPVLIVFLDDTGTSAGARVQVRTRKDDSGAAVMVAVAASASG